MFKKILCSALSFCMLLIATQTAQASSSVKIPVTKNYNANIAYVQNVNKQGTNLNDETVDGLSKSLSDNSATVEVLSNKISVTVNIKDKDIKFTGVPEGRTESGKTVFYKSVGDNTEYEVVLFSYVSDTSVTNMYFKNTKREKYKDSQTVLKLYVKDVASTSLDYYLIEIFDVAIPIDKGTLTSLPINHLLGAWAATQFQPISEEFGEIESKSATTKYWYCTKTFTDMGDRQTHTIRWRTNADCIDVDAGGDALQDYRLTVYAKNSTYTINTDLNSNTQSYLHVNRLSLRQSSLPYTAWKSTKVDGRVQNNGTSSSLSVSLGVSIGPLSVSIELLPTSFTNVATIDLDETFSSYENGPGGRYSRNIKTTMNSNLKLTQIGHYFYAESRLRSYSTSTQENGLLMATWDVEIINGGNFETYSYTCSHNSYIDVV